MNIPTDRNAIVVPVPRSLDGGKHVRDAASWCWRITDRSFLDQTELILAASNGRIVGVYDMRAWYYIDDIHLGPNYQLKDDQHGRVAFDLLPVNENTWDKYYMLPVSKHLQTPTFIKTKELIAI